MHQNSYVALLRGINVGGKNIIKMTDLKSCFEVQGFTSVRTYIQSGNVLFASPERNRARLTATVEQMLGKTFGYKAVVVIRSHEQLRDIVTSAPRGFGTEPANYRSDVLFIKEPETVKNALKIIELRAGVDRAAAGPGALYFSRLVSHITKSRLGRIVGQPIYQHITIRNWNTTVKLLQLLDETFTRLDK